MVISSSSTTRLDPPVEDLRVVRSDGLPALMAESPPMRTLAAGLRDLARREGHLLITGEPGAGKGTVARWIHALSPRASAACVAVEGREAVTRLEGALFGRPGDVRDGGRRREPGASNGHAPGCLELAAGGTLLVDGLEGLDHGLQVRLAEVLATGRDPAARGRVLDADVRVVATTSVTARRPLESLLHPALLERFAGPRLHVPSLRERVQDIPLLAMTFLEQHARRYGKAVDAFQSDAMGALLHHPWPGNVRELHNAIERAVLASCDDAVSLQDLGLPAGEEGPSFEEMKLNDVERVLIQKALVRHSGNVSRAARSLGLSRSALYRRLHRHGI